MAKYITQKVISVLNPNTGEIEPMEVSIRGGSNKGKGGWSRMYKTTYDEVMLELSSKLQMKMFIHVRDSFTRSKSIAVIKQSDMAQEFGTTKANVSVFFKKMMDIGFLHRVDRSSYFMNPYTYVPYSGNVDELQKEWHKLENL